MIAGLCDGTIDAVATDHAPHAPEAKDLPFNEAPPGMLGLQTALPINARFMPEPGPVPGYVDPVIMSSGSFISGSTIDLSCDAPLRAPWDVYLQGGIVAEHVALGAILAADAIYSGTSSPMKP